MKKQFLLFIFLCSTFLSAQDHRSSDMPESANLKESPVILKLPTDSFLTTKDYHYQVGALNPFGTTIKEQIDPGSSDVVSQQFEVANSNRTTNAADDFTVPAGKIWTIESVSATGKLVGTIQPTVFNVTFYNNSGSNLPDTIVRAETVLLATGSADPTLLLATPLILAPGKYWVSIQAVLNSTTQGIWFWESYNAFDTFDAPFALKNPGNAYGFPCLANWANFSTCTGQKFKDLQFKLTGTESALPCKTFTDRITAADPTQIGRMNRLSPASVCGTTKVYPGNFTTVGNYHYKTYSVQNTSAVSQCITFNITNADPVNFVHLTAYNTTFDPADLSQNYMGDVATSSYNGNINQMGITIPANTTVILVASETALNTSYTADYTIDVYSADCAIVLKTSENTKNKMSLYPNPTKKTLFVNGMDIKKAKVYDTSGKAVPVKNNGNDINVENLPKGTYLIQVEDKSGKVHSDKFIKN